MAKNGYTLELDSFREKLNTHRLQKRLKRHVCKWCGCEFTSETSHAQFCCVNHRGQYYRYGASEKEACRRNGVIEKRGDKYLKRCAFCGNEFLTPKISHVDFCCQQHRVKYYQYFTTEKDACIRYGVIEKRGNKYLKKCAYCGKEFLTTKISRETCCERCFKGFYNWAITQDEYLKRHNIRIENGKFVKQCLFCKKKFIVHDRLDMLFCCDKHRNMFAHHKMSQDKLEIEKECRLDDDMVYVKKCKICGKTFRTKNILRKTCSHSCKLKHRMKVFSIRWNKTHDLFEKTCPRCGKKFRTINKTKIFCSRLCTKKKHLEIKSEKIKASKNVKKLCAWCGEEFIPKRSDAPCCSKKCRELFINHRNKSKAEVEKKYNCSIGEDGTYIMTCEICGKTFKSKVHNAKFCSRRCFLDSLKMKYSQKNKCKNTPITKKCICCGNEFKTTNKSKKYCSEKCRMKTFLAKHKK